MEGLSVVERATMTPGRPPGSTSEAGPRHRRANRPAAPALGHPKAVALANPSPRVRLPEVIIGVLLVAGSALGALVWHSSSTKTTPAPVLPADVERGHVFVDTDFAAAPVKATGVRLVPFAEREVMVGRIAAVDLRAFDPVTEAVAVDLLPISADQALISLRFEAGQYPDAIAPGSTVRVVMVNSDSSAETSAGGVDASGSETSVQPIGSADQAVAEPLLAIVDDVRPGESAADTVIITLRVPNRSADAIAAAAEVRLVQINGKSS